MLSRRELLSSATAAAFAYSVAPSFAAEADPVSQLNALMDTFFRENLNENPEGATQLGFDKGENAGLKSKLRDETLTGVAHAKALNASQLSRLKSLDTSRLSGMDKVNYDTLVYVGEVARGGRGVRFRRHGVRAVALCREPAHRRLSIDSRFPRHQAQDRRPRPMPTPISPGSKPSPCQLDDNTERMKHDGGAGRGAAGFPARHARSRR